jgi:ParB-like chromosome segregation protein Spo0J
MQKETTIIRIPMAKLLPHPENPNRMSKANFEKLKLHIKQTGNYEPVIVRGHPEIKDCFQIINGHHRFEALKQIGETFVDCVQWNVSDDEVRILLTTLNRLGGKDELSLKIEIIKKLSEKYNAKELGKMLPDNKQVLEKLKDIMKPMQLSAENSKAFLNTLVFFLDDEQIKIVEKSLTKASKNSSKAEKKASALTKIAEEWFNYSENRR